MNHDDLRQRKRAEREAYKQAIRERERREPCLGELLYTPELDQQFQATSGQLQSLIDAKFPVSPAQAQDALDLLVTLRDRLSTLVCLDIERANRQRELADGHEPPGTPLAAAPSPASAEPIAPPPAGIDVQIQHRALDVLQELARLANGRTRRPDPLTQAVDEAELLLPLLAQGA
ncbi:MAG TPA: hypothetical protein VGE07_16865 [Herpetosiphonaceae bacterium]